MSRKFPANVPKFRGMPEILISQDPGLKSLSAKSFVPLIHRDNKMLSFSVCAHMQGSGLPSVNTLSAQLCC